MIETRPLAPADRPRWEALFRAYMAFYQRALDDAAYDRAWHLLREDVRLHGLGAWRGDELVGIAHFLVHPSSSEPDLCYLEDLFTDPAARGRGVATALVAAVRGWARDRGCGSVYWQTHETNTVARRLYDTLATYEGFVVYTLPVGDAGPRPTDGEGAPAVGAG